MHFGAYSGGYRRRYGGSGVGFGPTGGIVFVVILAVILLLLVVSQSFGISGVGITKSTIDREPLDKQYVTVGNTGYFEDHIGWIRSSAKLEKGLDYFFDKTGVFPYLVITEDIYGDTDPTGPEVLSYAEDIYRSKFRDEGHMVFVFQSVDESDNYMMACYTGAQAKVVLDDAEALEILYDYFDSNWYTDKDEEAFFADSFKSAANRIMHKTPNYVFIVCIAIAGVIALCVIFAIVRAIVKRKKEEAEETERILNTPIDQLQGR